MGKQLDEDMEKLSKNLESIGKTTRVSASNRPVSMTQSTSQETCITESNNAEMYDPNALEDKDNISMYDEDLRSDKTVSESDQCYACNECKETITGFRYTCVQCADWDLCDACEARAGHAAHYLLRIPTQRTNKEIQAVLAVIRHQLLSEVLLLPELAVSVDVQSEPEEPQDTAGPAAEPDPLGYSDKDDCVVDIDNVPKDPTPRKRIRSGTSHSRSEQNTLTSPDNSSNPTLHTLVHGNSSLHHHDYAKPAQNIHASKLPNDNPSNPKLVGLIRIPGAHHSTRDTKVPTRKVTSQPFRTRVTKKTAILRRPIVKSSTSGVKATRRRAVQAATATTEASASTSIPELERATTAVKRLFLKLPSGSNPADIIKSLRSKVTVRLKRIDISQ